MTISPIRPAAAAAEPGAEALDSVLVRSRAVIEAFASGHDTLSLADLVRRTGASGATVRPLVQELLDWGLLERSGTGYRLGRRLYEIGQRVPRRRILREAALPYMEDLLAATQETIRFAVLDGLDVLYAERSVTHRGPYRDSLVSGRLPLHSTAAGKAILAFSSASLFAAVVRAGLTPYTRRTITSPGVLRRQLDRVRQERLASEAEETRLGHVAVAVPVFLGDSASLVGALAVTAPAIRGSGLPRLVPLLHAAGEGIGRSLRSAERAQAFRPTPP
jgi:DNA-binding IclR family transcriptional regulator